MKGIQISDEAITMDFLRGGYLEGSARPYPDVV
jgi:hypothetical protein